MNDFAQEETSSRERTSVDRLHEWLAGFPHRLTVAGLLVGWVVVFVFWGNSTFGYSDSPSMFGWLHYAYSIDEENQHGYLIPIIVGILLYLKRGSLTQCRKSIFLPAIAFVLLAVLLHLIGYVVQQIRLSIVGFVLGVYGITGLFWGWNWMRITLFPFALFAFCIPLGSYADYITFPMRMMVTHIAVGFSHFILGIDVIREGTQILEVNRRFQYDVAPACSGIRSLFALTALTTVYGYLTFAAVWKRAVMILMAVPLAIAGNAIRIIAVIVAGQAVGQAAGVAIEQKLGFVTFLTAMIGILLIAKLLSRVEDGGPIQEKVSDELASSDRASENSPIVSARSAKIPAFVCLGLILGMGVFLSAWGGYQKLGEPGVVVVDAPTFFVKSGESGVQAENLVNQRSVGLPEQVAGYVSTNIPLQEFVVTKLPADTTYGQRRYMAADGFYVDNMVVLMGTDRTSIHQPQYCLIGSGWKIEKQESATIKMLDPVNYELPVMKLTTSRTFQSADGSVVDVSGVYLYWFVSGENITEKHGARMWSMAKSLIMRQELERWAYVTVFAPCQPGMEGKVFERMKQFIKDSVPRYQTFPQVTGSL